MTVHFISGKDKVCVCKETLKRSVSLHPCCDSIGWVKGLYETVL